MADEEPVWVCGAFEPLARTDLQPYRCTERSGHRGAHRAVMGLTVLAAWPAAVSPVTEENPKQ